MKIKTKSYVLPKNIFKKECYKDIFGSQWWINVILFSVVGYGVFIKLKSVWITALVFEIIYILFWIIQVTGIQYMPQNALLFGKISYIFSPENIILSIDSNRGSQIEWNQIIKVKYRKDYVVLFVSKIQFLYIPFSAFRSNIEKTLFLNLLRTKLQHLVK